MTLNTLEHGVLFRHYADARYHFALNCAARGCPVMANHAYRPEQLEEQLDIQTRHALNNVQFIQVDDDEKQVRLSQLFVWYRKDLAPSKQEAINWINQYRQIPIPADYKVSFYDYDWTLNSLDSVPLAKIRARMPSGGESLQAYTPSALLRDGQIEFKVFNNLYSQTGSYDNRLRRQMEQRRSNFFTSIMQFSYGVGPKLNTGFDVYFRSSSFRPADTSPLDVLRFDNSPSARTAIAYIGPKFKYAPFQTKGLSIQTTILLPVARDLQGRVDAEDASNDRPFLDHDGCTFLQQFFYDRTLSSRFSLFAEAALWARLDRRFDLNRSSVFTPFKGFLSYFPTNKVTIYGMTEWAPSWGQNILYGFYTQSGVGAKYQLTNHLEIEALYTYFWTGKNSGAGQTCNIGLRYLY